MNKINPAYAKVELEGIEKDLVILRAAKDDAAQLIRLFVGDSRRAHSDISRDALREAAAQIEDAVLPVLAKEIDELQDRAARYEEKAI